MADISFYHLERQPVELALGGLMQKVYDSGSRAVIRIERDEQIQKLDEALWAFNPDSFVPHGTKATSFADQQPIYLTSGEDNPNESGILVLVNKADDADMDAYDRVLYMFDGRDDETLSLARKRWKEWKDTGHTLTYWQQTERGGWQKKA